MYRSRRRSVDLSRARVAGDSLCIQAGTQSRTTARSPQLIFHAVAATVAATEPSTVITAVSVGIQQNHVPHIATDAVTYLDGQLKGL